jgi:hypothetical protein
MRFPSDSKVDGRLEAAPDVAHQTLRELGVADDPLRPGALVFVDTAGRGWEDERTGEDPSTRNPGQAERASAELRRLLRRGLLPAQVAVITPYEAQARALRGLLAAERAAGIESGTVDGYQGREKEAIVVDLVRSNDDRQIGFLADTRRMNVALTRARRFLLVVGDGATLAGHPYYDAYLGVVEQVGTWVRLQDSYDRAGRRYCVFPRWEAVPKGRPGHPPRAYRRVPPLREGQARQHLLARGGGDTRRRHAVRARVLPRPPRQAAARAPARPRPAPRAPHGARQRPARHPQRKPLALMRTPKRISVGITEARGVGLRPGEHVRRRARPKDGARRISASGFRCSSATPPCGSSAAAGAFSRIRCGARGCRPCPSRRRGVFSPYPWPWRSPRLSTRCTSPTITSVSSSTRACSATCALSLRASSRRVAWARTSSAGAYRPNACSGSTVGKSARSSAASDFALVAHHRGARRARASLRPDRNRPRDPHQRKWVAL